MAQISTVFLFSLCINPDNFAIELQCTKNFFCVLRTHMAAGPAPGLRIGSFDFSCVKDNEYVGIPNKQSEHSLLEASVLCPRILSVYRCALTFEKVFADRGSYETWMVFNHRPPSPKQLAELARAKGIWVPFLSFPYRSPLLGDKLLDDELSVTEARPQTYHSKHEVPGMPLGFIDPVNSIAFAERVAANATRYKRG